MYMVEKYLVKKVNTQQLVSGFTLTMTTYPFNYPAGHPIRVESQR
jgi:hypothetical protein